MFKSKEELLDNNSPIKKLRENFEKEKELAFTQKLNKDKIELEEKFCQSVSNEGQVFEKIWKERMDFKSTNLEKALEDYRKELKDFK